MNLAEGKSLNLLTRIILGLGVPISGFAIYELLLDALKDDPNPFLVWLFYGPIILLFLGILVCGIWCQFLKTSIDSNGISYTGLRSRRIDWEDIQSFTYPYIGFGAHTGFTPCAKIVLKNGKTILRPFGSGNLSKMANSYSSNFVVH